MTSDPYPDLPGAEPPERALGTGGDHRPPAGRPELSEADNRLLAALFRPGPPVVTAVEDRLRTPAAEQDGRPVPVVTRRGPLTPVFREPTD